MKIENDYLLEESVISKGIIPNSFLTRLIWRFLKIKIIDLPPKHVNCRCRFTLKGEKEI